MTIAWDNYLPEVLPEVPNCPDQVAINAIRSAAIDFCQKARVWRASFGPLSLTANTPTVLLGVPADTELVTIIQAAILSNGSWGDISGPYSEEHLDQEISGWREKTTDTLPFRYLNSGTNSIRVYPVQTANQANVLKGVMALKPSRSATGGDDILYNEWLDYIASGAKAKLMSNLTAEWKNENGAVLHHGMFRKGVNIAIARQLKGGRASLTAFYQSFK